MASSWSDNVQRYGLGQTGCTLAARVLNQPGEVVVTNAAGFSPAIFPVAWSLPTGSTQVYTFVFLFKSPGTNFPYGLLVEPDVPV